MRNVFGQDREQLRRFYCQSWEVYRQGGPLEPLQAQIVAVIKQHPEYQPLLENPDSLISRDFFPELGETNPFLHMGMHLALQEQLSTDRPRGIRDLYATLLEKSGDAHQLEHRLMDCLAEMIWRAQKDGETPDEVRYLGCIKSLVDAG